jgi:uncharacterized protein YgiM (DUF1202 family)/cell wall-associated NlpC family hydrolase
VEALKKIIIITAIVFAMFNFNISPVQAVTALYTSEEAVALYQQHYAAYEEDELVKVDQYRDQYKHIKGSLADKVIERAIWYMENGYSVYGHGLLSYHTNGVLDCSEFTKLVFGDFGFILTDVSRNYSTVGKPVEGLSSVNVNGKWELKGTENLEIGDILTWWDEETDGTRYISHVAIYMGELNGQPAVIGTASENPTALGIINNFNYWYGEHFLSVRRVLPEGASDPSKKFTKHIEKAPIIPESYLLPPQKEIIIPEVPEQPDSDNGPVVMTKYGWVSIFDTPNTNGEKLGRLEYGEEAPLIRQYNAYWYEIEYGNQIGYITASTKYTHVKNEKPVEEEAFHGPVVLTNTGSVGVFDTPSTSGTRLGNLNLGQKAPLIRKYNAWWHEIAFNGQIGYITANEKYTHLNGEEPQKVHDGPVVKTVSGWVGVFGSPSLSGVKLGNLEFGKAAPLIKKHNDWWYEIEFGNQTGYITTNPTYTDVEGELPAEPEPYDGPVVKTVYGWVGVYGSASLSSLKLGNLNLGEAAPLIKKHNDWWYEIMFGDQTGYITTSPTYTYVEGERPAEEDKGPFVITNSGWVGVFAAASLNGEKLGNLNLGEKAPLIKKHNDYWYEIKFADQVGYITANSKYTSILE